MPGLGIVRRVRGFSNEQLDGASHEGRDTGTAAILHNFPVVF
jgi:hypothetical protein